MTGTARIIVRLPADCSAAARAEYRPLNDVTPLVTDISIDDVPRRISHLFAICGSAHFYASATAIDMALGRVRPREDRVSFETAALSEAAREHGIGIARNWAALLGEPADHATARALVDAAKLATADAISCAITRHVTRISPAEWLAMTTADQLRNWAETTPSIAARFIRELFAESFWPTGEPVEPGTLVDIHANHPLLCDQAIAGTLRARFIARLIDLCRIPERIKSLCSGQADTIAGASSGDGCGQAFVPCARGVLQHVVRIEGDRFADYRIISPTDRAFAPNGSANRLLAALPEASLENRKRNADLVIQSLDPCTTYAMEVV